MAEPLPSDHGQIRRLRPWTLTEALEVGLGPIMATVLIGIFVPNLLYSGDPLPTLITGLGVGGMGAFFLATYVPLLSDSRRIRSISVSAEGLEVERRMETISVPWVAIEPDSTLRRSRTVSVRYRTRLFRSILRLGLSDWNWVANNSTQSGFVLPDAESVQKRSQWTTASANREFLRTLRGAPPAPFPHPGVTTKKVAEARRFGRIAALEFLVVAGFMGFTLGAILGVPLVGIGLVLGALAAMGAAFSAVGPQPRPRSVVGWLMGSFAGSGAVVLLFVILVVGGLLPLAVSTPTALFAVLCVIGVVMFLPAGIISATYASQLPIDDDEFRRALARWPRS